MPKLSQLNSIIQSLRSDRMSQPEVVSLLSHPAAIVRANAIEALERLGKRGHSDVVPALRCSAEMPESNVKLMGTVTLRQWAIRSLLRLSTPEADIAARELAATMPPIERGDLIALLRADHLESRIETG